MTASVNFWLLFPLTAAMTGSIINLLEEQVILVFSILKKIIAKNGHQFINSSFKTMMKEYCVDIADYPQANIVECTHGIIKTI